MKSFTSNAKLEILEQEIEGSCCRLAFLCGLLKSCGELSISGGKLSLDLIVDNTIIFDRLNKIIFQLYGEECSINEIDDLYLNKKQYFDIKIPSQISLDVLKDVGMAEDGQPSSFYGSKLSCTITESECCKKSFLKGVFLGCATSSIKLSERASEKTTSGYHLEFTSHNAQFLNDVAKLLEEYGLTPKIVTRKSVFVLYLKEASQICDLLAIIDATSCNLQLQNEIVAREMRNQVNRETNCFSANVAKTISASAKQLDAIEKIRTSIGLEKLDPDLCEVALLRIANQEESLDELLALSTIKLTKSGLYHRFKKIIKIAQSIEDKK